MKICPECQTQYADTTEFCERDGMKLRPVRTQADDPLIGVALDGRWIIVTSASCSHSAAAMSWAELLDPTITTFLPA